MQKLRVQFLRRGKKTNKKNLLLLSRENQSVPSSSPSSAPVRTK